MDKRTRKRQLAYYINEMQNSKDGIRIAQSLISAVTDLGVERASIGSIKLRG